MPVSKKTRFEAFKRDKFTCQYCGRRPPDVTLEADHIVPVCEDGPDDLENITTSCDTCNRGKSGNPLDNVAPALDEMQQLEALQEMAERRRAIERGIQERTALQKTEEAAIDKLEDWGVELFGEEWIQYASRNSLRTFLRKLDIQKIADAMEITSERLNHLHHSPNYHWKYFCGVCWKEIKGTNVRPDSCDA